MKKLIKIILGIILAILIPMLGILVTKYFEDGIYTLLSIILVLFVGIYLLKSKYREIGIGIIIGTIPVIMVTIGFIIISNLH